MKYTTILPAFLFLAGSALLPISSYAGLESDAKNDASYCDSNPGDNECPNADGDDDNNDGDDDNNGSLGTGSPKEAPMTT